MLIYPPLTYFCRARHELNSLMHMQAGYEHYEVSNYALPRHRCRHNEVYWRNEPYHAFGLGAASYLHHRRFSRPRQMAAYRFANLWTYPPKALCRCALSMVGTDATSKRLVLMYSTVAALFGFVVNKSRAAETPTRVCVCGQELGGRSS